MKNYNFLLRAALVFTFLLSACSSKQNLEHQTSYYKTTQEFTATYDKENKQTAQVHNLAFKLYKENNWQELEYLFTQNKLNSGWPPANGGYNIVDVVKITKGNMYDRYGSAMGTDAKGLPALTGTFTSPFKPNGTSYSFTQRALNAPENTYDFYYHIKVLKDLNFTSQNATIIPWFGKKGNGVQAMWRIPLDDAGRFPKTWNALAYEGLIEVTIVACPNGKYKKYKGTVIKK